MKYLSTQAKDDPHYYIHDEIGFNYRMTNLQAALGVAQMEELPEFIKRKQRNYEFYKSAFNNCEYCNLIPFRTGTCSNKWFYSICIDRRRIVTPMRELIVSLENIGIQTRAIWGLISLQKPYASDEAYRIDKATYYAERVLNIPSSTQITENEINYVAENVKQLLEGCAHG